MLEFSYDIRDITNNEMGKSIRILDEDIRRNCIIDAFSVNKNLLIFREYGIEFNDWIYKEKTNVNTFAFLYQINGRIEHHSFGKPIIQYRGSVCIYYYLNFAMHCFFKNIRTDCLCIIADADYVLDKITNDNTAKASILKSLDKIKWKNNLLYKSDFNFSVNTILDQIINCPFNDKTKQIYFEAKFLELLSLYLQDLQDRKYNEIPLNFNNRDIKKIYDARAYLNSNFWEPPTIRELAKIIGTNEFKLKKGFKQIFGSTIFEHITNLRMQKAKEILLDGQMSITEAGNMVGYSSASNFAKNFKMRFGMNPKEFLKIKK